MKAEDIRQLSEQELESSIRDHQKMLADLKFNHTIAPIENPARIRKIRKEVARMHTILKERKS
ncbi:MAG: 50S ribosomal protein L29 [Bacteroidetes bacterium]|jgi:large subunit ribosomal protein L29|nr:50S ribosomal protein L29 [Bacteroidota bacterium]